MSNANCETQVEPAITPRWLDVDGAAFYMSLSDSSVRRLISSGKLTPHRPVRGKIVLDRHQLDAYVSGCTVKPRTGRGLAQRGDAK